MNEFEIYWHVSNNAYYRDLDSYWASASAQNDNLQVHEEKNKGVYVKNLSDYYVGSAPEVYEIMRQGGQARIVSATSKFNGQLRL